MTLSELITFPLTGRFFSFSEIEEMLAKLQPVPEPVLVPVKAKRSPRKRS